jgi:hypothetical protein
MQSIPIVCEAGAQHAFIEASLVCFIANICALRAPLRFEREIKYLTPDFLFRATRGQIFIYMGKRHANGQRPFC